MVVSGEDGGQAEAKYPGAWSARHRGRHYAPLVGTLTLNENVVSFSVGPGRRVGAPAVLVEATPTGFDALVTIKAKTAQGRTSRLRYQTLPGGRYVVSGTIGVRARVRTFTSVSRDPRAVLEAVWTRALADAGIEWERPSGLSDPGDAPSGQVLAEVSSQPFDSIASEVNRRSVNVGAELLLRWAGGLEDPASRLNAHVRGITGEFEGVNLVDGSGLSRDSRATAMSFVSYLARFPLAPGGRNFPQLLPANGTGTLRKLANGLPEQGIVRAKTGTLGDVSTLAGYLGRADGVLLISLMYNGPRAATARQQQWRLFRLLGAAASSRTNARPRCGRARNDPAALLAAARALAHR
jgi:D-alanyl-D-alanine carboxypeptidase/D-alanyl-D-alanine-endopeptidase (penicillin-binding protein 4)